MRRALAVPVMLAALLAGCGKSEQPVQYALEKQYQSPPAELTMKLDRQTISVADEVDLVLEAVTDESEKVRFPAPGNKIGKFRVADTRSAAPELLEGNRLRTQQTYRLEPFLPGDYEIPPLEVRFGEDRVIKTEPVTVRVESVLPADAGAEPEIKDIVGPLSLPGFDTWVYVLAGVAVAALALFIWWRRRKTPEALEPAPLPHEVALRALRELMAEKLIERGEAKLFYLRVSAILRHYIEGRFGLRAPERTTEEFLYDLRQDRLLDERQKALLKEFLSHCDMVKFAEYTPSRDEIENTINTCGQFIAETKPADDESGAKVAVPATAGGGE